jgi:GNAT superfamily N-acetyltransferase
MRSEELRIDVEADRQTIETLGQRLWEYNVASTGDANGDELTISVRGPDGELRAGLFAHTWSGWLEVKLVWVHEDARGKGLGTRMLAAVEAAARERDCHTAILDTHSFQAPDFYKKLGYQEYLVLDGYPAGHSKIFLRKHLREG